MGPAVPQGIVILGKTGDTLFRCWPEVASGISGHDNPLYRSLIRSQSILPFRSATTLRPFRRARAPRPEMIFPSGSFADRRHSRWNSWTVTVRSPLLRFMLPASLLELSVGIQPTRSRCHFPSSPSARRNPNRYGDPKSRRGTVGGELPIDEKWHRARRSRYPASG